MEKPGTVQVQHDPGLSPAALEAGEWWSRWLHRQLQTALWPHLQACGSWLWTLPTMCAHEDTCLLVTHILSGDSQFPWWPRGWRRSLESFSFETQWSVASSLWSPAISKLTGLQPRAPEGAGLTRTGLQQPQPHPPKASSRPKVFRKLW